MNKTSDAVVILRGNDGNRVLLITRKNSPFKGKFAFPGGFIDNGEAPIDACIRELFEETDLVLDKVDAIPLSVRKIEGRDPRGHTISHPYLFLIDELQQIAAKDDAATASWVHTDDIKKLAFDHGAILCEALGKLWPIMPEYAFNDSKIEREVVFFGGSFNPWHKGHEECIRLFTEKFKKKKLIVLPDSNPWKQMEDRGSDHCFYESFFKLKDKLNKYPVEVYPGYWGKEGPNPTVSWLGRVRATQKGLLVGDDQFVGLKNWKNAKELLNSMDFLFVVPRNLEDNEREKVKNDVLKIAGSLKIQFLSDHDYMHISSTGIREKNEKR